MCGVNIAEVFLGITYHHGNLKAALVSAGLQALGRAGTPDLSLRALAGEIGVTVNAAYRHFPSKSALMLELAAVGFDEMRGRLLDACAKLDCPTPWQKLYAVGEAYVQFAQMQPALFRLMFDRRGVFYNDNRLQQASTASFEVLVECMADVRDETKESPYVMKASLAAWSLVHGYAMLTLEGYMATLPDALRLEVKEVVRAIDPHGVDTVRIPGATKK